MTLATNAVGAYGERVAARTLSEAGMRVVARNWRCRWGEIDVIAIDGQQVVFCEVKTRRSDRFGSPAGAVHRAKIRRLRALAVLWLAQNPQLRGEMRFDVISVRPQASGPAVVEHLRGAF